MERASVPRHRANPKGPTRKARPHTTEARKPAPGPDAEEMLAGGPKLPLLGPVPTSSLNPALPSRDNLYLPGWRRNLSDTVLHTTVLKTAPPGLPKDCFATKQL